MMFPMQCHTIGLKSVSRWPSLTPSFTQSSLGCGVNIKLLHYCSLFLLYHTNFLYKIVL